MSTADIRIFSSSGLADVPTYQWQTKAGNTAINPGEFVKLDNNSGLPYVKIIADGDGTLGQFLVGLAKSKDTVTSSADGVLDVYIPLPGVVYAAKAKSSTAANTNAKVLALVGKKVIFDVTSNLFTVDTAASDASVNSVRIIGGDYTTNTVYFMVPSGTWLINTGAGSLGS